MSFSISIIAFGKKNDIFTKEIDRYCSLVKPFALCKTVLCKPHNVSDALPVADILKREAIFLDKTVQKGGYCTALSEEGNLRTSMQFAEWLQKRKHQAVPLMFVLGSAFGLDVSFKKKCAETISLSPLTVPHHMALLILVEQLYRATTILSRYPYHK